MFVSSRHNVGLSQAGNYVRNVWKSAPNVLWNRQSQNNVLPFPAWARDAGPIASGGEGRLGETMRILALRVGKWKPRVSGEQWGAGRACRWDRGRGTEWAQLASQEKSQEVGLKETWDPWLKDRRAKCLCVCTVGHVDRAVNHSGSEEANSSLIFGHTSKASPDREAEGWGHSAAHAAAPAHLCHPNPKNRGWNRGAALKPGKDDSCPTAADHWKVRCFQMDSWAAAQSQTGILLLSFSSRLWELGPNLINFQWQLGTSLPRRPWKSQPLLS